MPGVGAFLLLGAAACGGSPKFEVSGLVMGGDGETIVMEKPGFHGEWYAVDSVHLSKDGRFRMKCPSPASPEVYRLRLDDRYVYFPVDSVEKIGIETDIKGFGHIYTLSGSENAANLSKFENDFARFGAALVSPDSTAAFKRRVYAEYMQPSPGSIVSYHILTKTMADGTPLYDISGSEDYRYLAAVATGFKQVRPDDPHTAMLEAFAVKAMREKNREKGIHTEIRAEEIAMPHLALNDETGKLRQLSDVVGKGEPVILVFSPLTDPEAPARNKELMDRYKRGGIRIYQVSYDADQYGWREAAGNLPWITVNDPSGSAQSAIDYNVTVMPAYFYIDAAGNLTKRADRLSDL